MPPSYPRTSPTPYTDILPPAHPSSATTWNRCTASSTPLTLLPALVLQTCLPILSRLQRSHVQSAAAMSVQVASYITTIRNTQEICVPRRRALPALPARISASSISKLSSPTSLTGTGFALPNSVPSVVYFSYRRGSRCISANHTSSVRPTTFFVQSVSGEIANPSRLKTITLSLSMVKVLDTLPSGPRRRLVPA